MKAQASAEFMISLAIMLIIFLLLSGIASEHYVQARHERIDGAAKALLATFTMNVNAVVIAGDGATLDLSLPRGIDINEDYAISILPGTNMVRITYTNPGGMQYYDLPIVTRACSGRLEGINGTVMIENDDEGVHLG